MSGFGPGDLGGGFPYPPVDIPAPETPPPNFTTIGQGFAEAQTQAQSQWSKDISNFEWLVQQLLKWIGAILGLAVDVASLLIAGILTMFQGADPSINNLVRVVISGMFGTDIPFEMGASIQAAAGREDTATGIAQVFAKALQTGQTSSAGLQPSHAGADAFMTAAAHMAFEGWFLGWVAELAGLGQLETFAELKDIMESSLGIGRMARRVMAPPVKILVEDPYTWLLNQTWLPALLAPGEAVRSYLRGKIDRGALQAIMNLHGYKSDYVDDLIADQVKPLTMPEILDLTVRGIFQTNDAIQALKQQGYDDTAAAEALGVAQRARVDAWNRKGVEEALALYRQGKMARTDYDFVVENSGLASDEQNAMKGLATIVGYGNRTRFSMGEGETLVKKGIWTEAQLVDLAAYHGYSAEDQTSWQLLVDKEVQDAAAAAAKRAQLELERAAAKAARDAAALERKRIALMEVESKGVSTAEYEALVSEGLRSTADYRQYLINKQIAPDNADALVTSLGIREQAKKDAAAAKAAAKALAHTKKIDIAQLEAGVKQGLITLADFTARLVQMGMPLADAALVAQELQGQMDTAAAKAKATADAKAAAKVKGVDLSQEERAVRLGLQTVAQYQAFLTAHGYTAESSAVLVSELQAQLDADKQTAAKKAAAAAKAAAKGISLSQMERLVRAGVKAPADYQAALVTAGVDASDQAALMDFLQLQMAQDQQTLITKGKASALVDQLGVSLTDLERAVKLGVVPIDTYQSALQRAGVSAADQQTMVQTLAAQIKTTKAQQTTSASVSKQVAAAGVSLATLEKDTIAGKISIEQFQGLLAGYGVSSTDAADVVALVQDEIDNAKAVQALVNQATARAAAKGLNLAQDTAAYKAGVMDEATWRSRVASLGYDDADVEILFETLAAAQAATAAKAAAKAGTSTTAAPPAGTSAAAGG